MFIRKLNALLSVGSLLTKYGRVARFMTGVAAVAGGPKAVLFYIVVHPRDRGHSGYLYDDIASGKSVLRAVSG